MLQFYCVVAVSHDVVVIAVVVVIYFADAIVFIVVVVKIIFICYISQLRQNNLDDIFALKLPMKKKTFI